MCKKSNFFLYFKFMTINQLFRKEPELEFLKKLLKELDIDSVTDTTKTFTRIDIDASNLAKIIMESQDVFRDIYLPCKFNVYFKNLDSKKIVTVLRQCLKTHNITIDSSEKCINGEKMIVYKLNSFNPKVKVTKNKGLVTFD